MWGVDEGILSRALVMAADKGWRMSRNYHSILFTGRVSEEYESSAGHVVTLIGARRIRTGLFAPGGSGSMGWQSITITPDMVGKRVAVFTAIDPCQGGIKTLPAQARAFLRSLVNAGGRSYVVSPAGGGVVNMEEMKPDGSARHVSRLLPPVVKEMIMTFDGELAGDEASSGKPAAGRESSAIKSKSPPSAESPEPKGTGNNTELSGKQQDLVFL